MSSFMLLHNAVAFRRVLQLAGPLQQFSQEVLLTAPRGKVSVFAHKLKKYRKRAGLSQLALAEELGVKQSTVSRWESGTSNPVGLYLARLERLFQSGGVNSYDHMARS